VTIKDEDRTCQTRSTTPTSTTKRSTARTSLCRSPGTTQVCPTASTRSQHSSSLSMLLSRTLSEPPPPSLTRAASIHKSLYSNRWTLSICHTELKVGRGGCGRHGGLRLADAGDLQMQWSSGLVDAGDLVDCGHNQGPGGMERKGGVFCSHIASKNTSIF